MIIRKVVPKTESYVCLLLPAPDPTPRLLPYCKKTGRDVIA